MTEGKKETTNKSDRTREAKLPVLPLGGFAIFPDMDTPVVIKDKRSIEAVEEALRFYSGHIITAPIKTEEGQRPRFDNLHETGTRVKIMQHRETPEGGLKLFLRGVDRVNVSKYTINERGFINAEFEKIESYRHQDNEILEELANEALKKFIKYLESSGPLTQDMLASLQQPRTPEKLALYIASNMNLGLEDKLEILANPDVEEMLEDVLDHLDVDLMHSEANKAVSGRVQREIEKNQREYYLREQKKAIEKELGDDSENELDELEGKLKDTAFTAEAAKKVAKDFKRLKSMNPQSPEATVLRNYLEAMLDVPWNKPSEVNNDAELARKVLDEDHYGLDTVKDKVVKSLAVQSRLSRKGLKDQAQPKIICLVGPPGVGKTSIAQSLAKATGREYVRLALGGVRDESEIRGHRRTYIGAKSGKIVESLSKAGTSNPLFVLDEIDKMGSDPHRGDPASAMLEVLDPEQNKAFRDHYLDVDYDLSDVMFVCTANVWGNIPGPLQDRMDTIFLGSYTAEEKFEIAKRHLIRKQMAATGLEEGEFSIEDNALRDLISSYTKESGVRNLQREIGNLCSEAVQDLDSDSETTKITITRENLEKYAGPRRYSYKIAEAEDEIGVVNGLAYTSVGGETLSIEAVKWPEKGGRVSASGKLGDVMKESIKVAEVLLKANAEKFGLDLEKDVLSQTFHVHVPEGAVPKDGPSAGAAMLTAIFSEAAGRPVRKDIAMTGELTTRGKVTAIGGVREKLAAAARAGYKTVLIPAENEKDLKEVPQQIKDKLEIIPVRTIEEVLQKALVGGFTPAAPKLAHAGPA